VLLGLTVSSLMQHSPDVPTEGTDIPEINLTVKHPLQTGWTLWYDNPQRKLNPNTWGDHLKRVYTFDTVEDFWCLWNNIKGAHELPTGSDYHLFKQGIEPKWEDLANTKGGKWLITFKTTQRETHLNKYWLDTILAIIGNEFEDVEEITGVVMSVRKVNDRISIWTQNAAHKERNLAIGQKMKDILEIQGKISYFSHADAMANTTQRPRARYEL